MSRFLNFLSRGEWTGIGVIVAIVALFSSFNYSGTPEELAEDAKETSVVKRPPLPLDIPKAEIEPKKQEQEQEQEQEQIAFPSLNSLVRAINSSEQDNLDKIYNSLVQLLENSSSSQSLIDIVSRWKEPLTAKDVGNGYIISTIEQYKIDGFILYFDKDTQELLSAYYDFGLGIKAIKVYTTHIGSPQYIVAVKYMTQSGTGLYGESVKYYAIQDGNMRLALEKPYYEYLDGSWGAYKSDVLFEQSNRLEIEKSNITLVSKGRLFYTKQTGEEVQVELPDEEYAWDRYLFKFTQTAGRATSEKTSMSEMYADYAEPNGDWFEAPKGTEDSGFKKEQW
ncbi:hypothetical protein ACED63_23685 [Vibrio splendidus]|uniref:hypothetical protein n=2 Tax=Vibrio TaxID=662 RepID=UPI00352EEBA7